MIVHCVFIDIAIVLLSTAILINSRDLGEDNHEWALRFTTTPPCGIAWPPQRVWIRCVR